MGVNEQPDQRALSETRACRFRNRLLADLSAWPRVAFGLGLAWWRGQLHLQMICGVYVVLGIFLIAAARNPAENRSLISFTIWSSVVHAAIMAVQALYDSREHGHLVGDVPALLLVAAVLWLLSPKGERFIGATA
jgi:hypothetical protein